MLGSDQAPLFALIYFYCPSKLPAQQKCIANPRSLKKPFHLELAEGLQNRSIISSDFINYAFDNRKNI